VNLFLLQEQVQYFQNNNPIAGTVFLAIIGVTILGFIIVSIVKNGLGMGKGVSKGKKTPRHFSIFSFYRISKMFGLNSIQSKTLEQVLRNSSVVDLQRAVNDPVNLDKHFKLTYKLIEKNSVSDEEMQSKMAVLFSTRNIIEIYHNTSSGSSVPPQLSQGMDAVL
jgi:hypothetical protein